VRAWQAGDEHAVPWQHAHTIAAGIRVPGAIGDFLILRAVRESGGFAIRVDDDAIRAALAEVARVEGLLLCPEGAATLKGTHPFIFVKGRVPFDYRDWGSCFWR
jgi:threonine synthase